MYEISKAFEFCYGHRVWSQILDEDYAGTNKPKCRHLHGHEGKVVIHLEALELKDGMITDFNHLNWLKQFIDDNIDHKFIIDRNDPLFLLMTEGFNETADVPDLRDDTLGAIQEYIESFYIVDFVPTSENLAKWMFDLVQEKMTPLGVRVSKVEWWETPKSRSVYGV